MSTLTLFQGFCVLVHIFVFKNTLEKPAKWTLQWKVLVHPSVCIHPQPRLKDEKIIGWENVPLI
jgi:hypothetical protein